jgi:hypothetical protein
MDMCAEADGFHWLCGWLSETRRYTRRLLMEESAEMKEAKQLTASMILGIKQAYRIMCQKNQSGVLKQNTQIMTRLLAAAKTCTSVGEVFTAMHRSLNLPAPNSSLSKSFDKLKQHVGATIGDSVWLAMIDDGYAEIIAMVRLMDEQGLPGGDSF